MQDVALWEELLTGRSEPGLASRLAQLADLPGEERFPFFDLLRRQVSCADGEGKAAALSALAGARGRPALQLFLEALPHPQALEGLARAVESDPLRWIHAAFHPDPEVRRASLTAARNESMRQFALFLLEDPALHELALEQLPRRLGPECSNALLSLSATGSLPRSVARALLRPEMLQGLLDSKEYDARARQWLAAPPASSESALEDPLELVVALYSEEGQEGFWQQRISWLSARGREEARPRWVAAVLRHVLRGGEPAGLGLAALFFPACLGWTTIAEEARRGALAAYYRHGSLLDRLARKEIESLSRLPVFWRDSLPDLWALGGLLFRGNDPYRLLLSQRLMPLALLRQGLEARPEEASALFLLPDPNGRQELLRALAGPVLTPVRICALLLMREPEEALTSLEALAVDERMQLFRLLEGWQQQPGVYPAGPRLWSRVTGMLGEALVASTDEFLRTYLGGELTELGQDLLAIVARQAGADEMLSSCQSLAPALGPELAARIEACPAFPYAVQMALAHAFPWARAWLAEDERVPLPATEGARALRPEEQERVAGCLEVELDALMRELAGGPRTGLAGPLALRPPPSQPHLQVCLALLGCADPLPEVAVQFERFGSADPRFFSDLETRVVKRWQGCAHLPVQGHAWLHRWDRHLDALGAVFETSLPAYLEAAIRLPSPPLSQKLWKAAAGVASLWSFREPDKLDVFGQNEVLQRLLEELPGENGPAAATIFLRLSQAGLAEVEAWRERVAAGLPDFSAATREMLSGWIRSEGLVGRTATRECRGEAPTLTGAESLDELGQLAAHPDARLVSQVGLALVCHGPPGLRLLLEQIAHPAPWASVLLETLPLWPEDEWLERIRALPLGDELRFRRGLAFLERGEGVEAHWEEMVEAACQAGSWFTRTDWERWRQRGAEEGQLARALAVSAQPHAYTSAVERLLESQEAEPLQAFLRQGRERRRDLRLAAARALADQGQFTGFPLLLQEAVESGDPLEIPEDLALTTLRSLLLSGGRGHDAAFLRFFDQLPLALRQKLTPTLLPDCASDAACGRLARLSLGAAGGREALLERLATTYAWGVQRGRELTGRLFSVEMHAGDSLGFTFLGAARIFVNPLPMLRRVQHGEDIVKGLMVHEIGHHMFHAREAIWDQARAEGLGRLFNLVTDEHLERNLRERRAEDGDRLKRLGAYAFQHAERELQVSSLLHGLGRQAWAVLHRTPLGLARRSGCVETRSRTVLSGMEKLGQSFARFVRALRMGLGNRSGDPRVEAGLRLFDRRFKELDMEGLLEVTRQLAALFGEEIRILDSLDQDREEWAEVLARGMGIDNEELQASVRRILAGGRMARPQLNLAPDETFRPIPVRLRIAQDPVRHRQYAAQVARSARRMRALLEQLGLQHVPQRRRMQGRQVDRSRLGKAIVQGEVRILVARQLRHVTDLFLGLLVDCSGSMSVGDQIHKARLFATMLAEAARGMPGIDLRIFGFTDQQIFDAGDARRCAASSLETSGGNNDAAALAAMAELALQSRRRARVLVMISDGLPTECTVASLRALVRRLTRQHNICCAQVAVRPLEQVCFPHYVLLDSDQSLPQAVEQFGRVVGRLVRRALQA